jgi:hypothetical protein
MHRYRRKKTYVVMVSDIFGNSALMRVKSTTPDGARSVAKRRLGGVQGLHVGGVK